MATKTVTKKNTDTAASAPVAKAARTFKANDLIPVRSITQEKFYAQANQLDKLLALQRRSEIRAQKLMRDYGYQNSIWSSREG